MSLPTGAPYKEIVLPVFLNCHLVCLAFSTLHNINLFVKLLSVTLIRLPLNGLIRVEVVVPNLLSKYGPHLLAIIFDLLVDLLHTFDTIFQHLIFRFKSLSHIF